MKIKIIAILCIYLILSVSVFSANASAQAASSQFVPSGREYDADADGVCDLTREEFGQMIPPITYLRDCTITDEGDKICPSTPAGQPGMRGGPDSGCSEEERQRLLNYWSINVKEVIPPNVRLNWLRDQREGVKVFVPIEFTKNEVFGTIEREAILDYVSFSCRSTNGNYLRGSPTFIRNSNDNKKYQLAITIRKFTEEELRETDVLKGNLVQSFIGKTNDDLGAIQVDCEASSRSSVTGDDGIRRPISGREVDEFTIYIPLRKGAVRPPDQALEYGIAASENIVKFIDKLLPKITKARQIALGICAVGIVLVLLVLTVGSFIVGPDEARKIANKIWKGPTTAAGPGDITQNPSEPPPGGTGFHGPEGAETVPRFGFLIKGSSLVSVRSFCGFSLCPPRWCSYLAEETKTTAEGTKTRYDDLNENFRGIFKFNRPLAIQDSLILSIRCGCLSGIELNLLRIKKIAEEYNRCLITARTTGVYVAKCDQYLQRNMCEYVIRELRTFGGTQLLLKPFKALWSKAKDLFGIDSEDVSESTKGEAAIEGPEAAVQLGRFEGAFKEDKNFINTELKDIGLAEAQTRFGYTTDPLSNLFCELAIFRRLPKLDAFEAFNIKRTPWRTSIGGEWKFYTAYTYTDNQGNIRPVRGYDISWTIIAGRPQFSYTVYLQTSGGVKRILERGNGVLEEAGDIVSDYIQITDEKIYDRLCVETPRDVPTLNCFPPGRFSQGVPFSTDVELFASDDQDGDGLPDYWENRYNCDQNRVSADDFENGFDKNSCERLVAENEGSKFEPYNKLDPNNADTDGDGVKDYEENPDGDIYTNYEEFTNNFHPNAANVNDAGELIPQTCHMNIRDLILDGGEEVNDFMLYTAGSDEVNVLLDAVPVSGEETDLNQLDVGYEIKRQNNIINAGDKAYSQFANIEDPGSPVVSRTTLFEIPSTDEIGAGLYDLTLTIRTSTGPGNFRACVDENGRTTTISKQFLIRNPNKIGCFDTDNGAKILDNGVCIDKNGFNVETNNVEYVCESGTCVRAIIGIPGEPVGGIA